MLKGIGPENMIVQGNALTQIKEWDEVKKTVKQGIEDIFKDGEAAPGEAYEYSYSPGNIPSYLKKVWEGKEELISPVHIIGSFRLSVRVNQDGHTMTVALYDSKTISSLSDGNLGKDSNKERDKSGPSPLSTQYIRFIWTVEIQKSTSKSTK